MVKIIFFILLILVIALIGICIYFIYTNYKSKKINKNSVILKDQVQDAALELIRSLDSKQLDEDNLYLIKKYIKSKNYRKETINFLLELPNRNDVINLVEETNLLDTLLKSKDKDEFDKAYKINIIGEFKLNNYMDYLMTACDDKHMYVQVSTIKSLAKLGNVEYFVEGLTKIVTSTSLIHEKIIIDAIYSFEGKKEKLNKALNKKLISKNEKEELKIVILNHFINIKYDYVKEDIYNILLDESYSKELKLVGIKYFINIEYLKAKLVLIKLLNHECWEIRAISASALRSYKDKEVILNLKQSIKDSEWYVRQNSARSLFYLADNKDDLTYVINGEDKYAADSMLSILSEENKLDEFIFDINIPDVFDKFEERLMVEKV